MAAAWSMSRCRGLRTRAIDYRLEPVLGERDNFPSLGVPKRLALKQPLNQVWAFLRSVCSRGISAMVSRTLARSEAKETAWLDLPLRAECELDQGEESCRSSCHPRGRGRLVRAASVTPEAICLGMTQGRLRISPGVPLLGVGRCGQRLTSGLPKPITNPCGSLTQLATRSGTSAGIHPRFS